jgi:hypothetical protein
MPQLGISGLGIFPIGAFFPFDNANTPGPSPYPPPREPSEPPGPRLPLPPTSTQPAEGTVETPDTIITQVTFPLMLSNLTETDGVVFDKYGEGMTDRQLRLELRHKNAVFMDSSWPTTHGQISVTLNNVVGIDATEFSDFYMTYIGQVVKLSIAEFDEESEDFISFSDYKTGVILPNPTLTQNYDVCDGIFDIDFEFFYYLDTSQDLGEAPVVPPFKW